MKFAMVLLGSSLIGMLALADPASQSPYDRLSETEKAAMRDSHLDSDGRWIGSRYWWIDQIEQHQRPSLQTDEALWKKVDILCTVCDPGAAVRQRMFDRLRRQRDESNQRADERIANVIADESGHYRRQMAKDNAERRRRTQERLKLSKLELAVLDAMLDTEAMLDTRRSLEDKQRP